ncbi:MAG: hypothetical protein WED15_08885 [Akkermansiaceae bacterium]
MGCVLMLLPSMTHYRLSIHRAWMAHLLCALRAPATLGAKEDPAFGAQPITVKQVGYPTFTPKRLPAPKSADGAGFNIIPSLVLSYLAAPERVQAMPFQLQAS